MGTPYNDTHHKKALEVYEEEGRNLSAVADREGMPTRPTLHSWRADGLPTEMTGGDDWDSYLDKQKQRALDAALEGGRVEGVDWNTDTPEAALESDLKVLYDEMRARLRVSNRVPSVGDIEKLSRLIVELNRSEDQKIAWMKMVATRLAETVVKHVDDPSTLQRIKSGMSRAVADEEHALLNS